VTAYPAWTPAPRPGIVPLHPLGFGTILGRSFVALRQNPKVLLGFALCVQIVAYLVLLVATGGVAVATFSRLDTLQPGTDDFDAVLAGSIALTGITALVLSLAAGALGVIVQGVVVSEVASAVVAEKPTLRQVWQRVKPIAWRLIGYSFLLSLAALVLIALVAGLLILIGLALLPLGIVLGILAIIGSIPLALWLTTKLLLVPSIIILEHARIRDAIVRSWQLTRGRFWSVLGISVIISLTFSVLAQIVSLPTSLLTSGLTTALAPTGDPDVGAIIAVLASSLLTQVLTLFVQCVAVIVQSTAAALIYIDCRMRHEGLDLDLQTYVDRRDAGATDLVDPFRENIGRVIAPRPPDNGYSVPGGYPAPGGYPPPYPGAYPQQYPAGQYAPPQYAPPQPPAQYTPQQPAPPQYAPQKHAPQPYPAAPPLPAHPAATDSAREPADAPAPADAPPTRWTAPGEGS
jgi:membrane-anchored glycerophosphoryl diester phosphodiesterase (GDPDase)